ncbi:unnamed protein product [Ranitomeya imitator]|uniref:Reverse transcriptase domain-containing protein n=1 Tax=Ranitomeya imitator TaxID=111125 RepID=A0ABN9LM73_9NEOB|nr:unnamed protein product [Ranitomeya imitator]
MTDTFYIQKCGTAMGSNVTPAYANAFMNHFEISHVFTNDLFIRHVLCYHRYIDDIFLVWTGNPDTLLSFHSHLNSILPELQFTIHYNTDSVPFLDTMVLKDMNGGLSTDIYSKPTDCNSLLHYTSCHPRSLKNSLPRSQFNRVARIVSDPGTLNDRLETMAHKFQARCYPSKLLTEEKACTLSPPPPRPPSNAQERIPFVHEFHPLVPKIHFIIRRHWPLLAKAYPNVPTFKEPVLMCNKRPPNIKDKLEIENLVSFCGRVKAFYVKGGNCDGPGAHLTIRTRHVLKRRLSHLGEVCFFFCDHSKGFFIEGKLQLESTGIQEESASYNWDFSLTAHYSLAEISEYVTKALVKPKRCIAYAAHQGLCKRNVTPSELVHQSLHSKSSLLPF